MFSSASARVGGGRFSGIAPLPHGSSLVADNVPRSTVGGVRIAANVGYPTFLPAG